MPVREAFAQEYQLRERGTVARLEVQYAFAGARGRRKIAELFRQAGTLKLECCRVGVAC